MKKIGEVKRGTPEFVVAHAERQKRRGRGPSVSYKWFRNPRLALEAARLDLGFCRGRMPRTDFHYEEFEGLLGTFYLSLILLKDGDEEDKNDFQECVEILNRFAQWHGVRSPEISTVKPRPTRYDWGRSRKIDSCFSIFDLMSSFWRDFGVGMEPDTRDAYDRNRLGRRILNVLHRHGAIIAEFVEHEGVKIPVKMLEKKEKFRLPLGIVLRSRVAV